jgi:DNA polymerase I-like protein with 3'-5' exonuclease and polymerase domains
MNSKIIQKLTERVVTYDVETTTTAKGSPFNELNKLVMIQYKINDEVPVVLLPDEFHKVKPVLESASVIVGTNLKFDLHWLQRELSMKVNCVWDLQISEFLFWNLEW